MKRVDRLLPEAIQSREVLHAAKAQTYFRDWTAIVGETLARKSWPDRYGKGTVWVAVEGSAWASELRMRKSEILARLRERCGDPEMFKDVRFGVRPLPQQAPEAETAEAERAPTPQADPQEERLLSIREIAERRLAKWKS